MNTTRVNGCMCITKKNSKRSEVWSTFLEFRKAGRRPILLDSSKGWSYVALPALVQKPVDFSVRGEVREGPEFIGGWIGFLTYDLGMEWMGMKSRHAPTLPKQWWRFCDEVYAFEVTEEDGLEGGDFVLSGLEATLSFEEYKKNLEEIQELEKAGETYQVNFTYPFRGDFSGDPFALYMALFQKNPSTHCFFAEDEDWAIASNSPERLFSLHGRKLRAEPIKGTVAANVDSEILLNDKKAEAELTMIVDLLRNDLARVSKVGSVKVPVHREIMQLSHVKHSYSVIESELKEGVNLDEVLHALFPGGSITGCPKKRTMEIIDRLENFSRGAYCGSAGFISVNGNADFNIMIRSGTIQNGQLEFPVGGGILVDSNVEAEWGESLVKAGALKSL